MKIDWANSAHRGLVVRAAQCLSINRALWDEADAKTMTVINLAEFNGFIGGLGPVRRSEAGERWPVGTLVVGNKNGSLDVDAWQINGAAMGLFPWDYALLAYGKKWKRRQWQPWVAWRRRQELSAQTTPMKKEDAQFMVDWDLFVAAVNEAAKMTALPKRYRDAIIATLGAEPERKKPVL